jgi:hypothetical protein
MLPEFDTCGNLPPGIWTATIGEVEVRYASNIQRQKLFQAFKEVLEILRAANCPEVYLNGSFICKSEEPGDYDMCYEWRGMQPTDEFHTLLKGTPDERKKKHLGDIFIRMSVPPYLEDYVESWQADRDHNVKGIIRIEL